MADRTTVVGRLGQEPRTKATARGDVVEFSVATTTRTRGPDGSWTDGETVWYRVSAWDRLGANAARSLRRGQPVIVHGELQHHEWTGRDGEVRRELQLRARAIGHDLNAGTSTFERGGAAAPPAPHDEPAPDPRPAAVREPAPAGAGWSAADAAEPEPPF